MKSNFLKTLIDFIKFILRKYGAKHQLVPDLSQEVLMNMYSAGYLAKATVVDERMRALARVCCRHTVYKFWRAESRRTKGLRGFADQLLTETPSQQIDRVEMEDELCHLIDTFEKTSAKSCTVKAVRMFFDGATYAEIDALGFCSSPARAAIYSFVRFARRNCGEE